MIPDFVVALLLIVGVGLLAGLAWSLTQVQQQRRAKIGSRAPFEAINGGGGATVAPRVFEVSPQWVEKIELMTEAEARRRTDEALLQADAATDEAELNLSFAQAQVGEQAAASFAADIERARELVREAFACRSELDSAEPPFVPSVRRAYYAHVLDLCERVSTMLAAAEAATQAPHHPEN